MWDQSVNTHHPSFNQSQTDRSYLAIFLCVGAREQRMEDNDCLVQIPHKHPLESKEKKRGDNERCYVHSSPTGQRWVVPLSISLSTVCILRPRRAERTRIKGNTTYPVRFEWNIQWVFLWSLTSRSLSGGGEGLFLRPLPRDLDPPLRQARSSSSLMGVEGLCTVSKSPESGHKNTRSILKFRNDQMSASNCTGDRALHSAR